MSAGGPRRVGALAWLAVGLAAIGVPSITALPPLLVYNESASVAPGFYRVRSPAPLRHGDLVLAYLPPAVAALAQARGYLPAGIPLLKPVAALGGDRVCAGPDGLLLNGQAVAHALAADHRGRPLRPWDGCRVLGPHEVLLLRPGVAHSFDGRYFGPLDRAQILAAVTPLLTWGAP